MEYDLMAKERMITELSMIAESAASNQAPRSDETNSCETTDEAKIVIE